MNKEHIKNLAKEFCEAEGIKNERFLTRMVQFLQSMIEKGEVFERHDYDVCDQLRRMSDHRIKQLEKEVQDYRGNTATPAKVISDEEIEDKIKEQFKSWKGDPILKNQIDWKILGAKWYREQLIRK